MIPLNKDLTSEGLKLLLQQFGDKDKLTSVLSSYLESLDIIENDLFSLTESFNIDDATDSYLDCIGKLVGVSREEDDDESYRLRIRIQVLINNSKGTPDELLVILSNLTNTDQVRVWEHYPCSSVFYTNGSQADVKTLNALIKSSPITSEVDLLVDTTNFGVVFNELVDDYEHTKQNLLAEILEGFDTLVDDNGNYIVDQDGNNLVVSSTGLGAFSYYGILNELIT